MSEEIQVVQVGAAGAALAQASAALALQYKNETSTLKGQVDTAKAAVDVAKAAVDVAKGQVDTAKSAVDVAKAAVDVSQADVIARQAVVVAAQATTEGARDTAVAQAGVATTKAAESAGSASLALAIFGTADNLNAAQQIMLGYANTAQAQAGLAASSAASASSVAQQDLSGVTAAALHRSPNAVTAMCVYDTSKDSDGGAWVEKCSHLSWANEALNGTYLPGGFASEMDMRDYLGSYQAASIVTGDSSNFASGVGSWVATAAHGTASAVGGRLRLTQIGALGTTAVFALAMTTTVGQRYQIELGYMAANIGGQNLFVGANTVNSSVGAISLNMGSALGTRRLSFVATATTTYLILQGSTAWPTNGYVEVDNITVKPVTLADPAGAFGQLSTDGKFYRPYKNILKASRDFTAASWTKAGAGTGTVPVVTPNAALAPDGSMTATTISCDSGAGTTSGDQSMVTAVMTTGFPPTGTQVASTIYVKGTAGQTILVRGPGSTAYTAFSFSGAWQPLTTVETSAGSTSILSFGLRQAVNGTINSSITFSVLFAQLEYGASYTSEEIKTTDGSYIETFRGNKAKFPRLAPPVCEGSRSTLYDLTETGRPAWMTFVSDAGNMARGTVAGAAMLNGYLALATNAGVAVINFAKDAADLWTTSGRLRYRGCIAQRNSTLGWDTVATGAANVLASNTVNAVAMCVLPDAPVDPVTGLQVPTIACFTGGGISVIQHDGTVRNSSLTNSFTSGEITPKMMTARWATSSWYLAPSPGALGASFAMTGISGSQAPGFNGATAASKVILPRRDFMARYGGNSKLALMRVNESTPASSLVAWIDDTYNTGWWCGDIRRVWCADTAAGAASDGNLCANGTFGSDTAGWSSLGAFTSTAVAVGGEMQVTATAASGMQSYSFASVIGQRYRVTGTGRRISGSGIAYIGFCSATGGDIAGAFSTTTTSSSPVSMSAEYTATETTTRVFGRVSVSGDVAGFDDIVITEVVADRCYKAKAATIYGTLARTAVAAAAQLVFYTGWSAANYLQEAYSADLDPATGNLAVRAWGTIPTNVAAAGWALDRSAATGAYYRLGHSATGQIVGELYDGTTTRTVTTTATYATGQALEFGMEYVPNGASSTLTLKVGGRQVAQSTFAALNSLSNATAVATVGIDRALTAPWAGGLALVKVGMTAASANASAWMFELEKQMFRPGAQVTLPSASSLVDVSYDEATDTVSVVDAANEAHFVGVVRVSTAAVPAGAFSKVARGGGGLKLVARTGTNPGVDVTVPAQNLREELVNRELAAARRARLSRVFDFDSVTGQVDFALPPGWEAIEVMSAGASKREGATKDWTRVYDGFVETVRFGVSPGGGAWVQVTARRAA